MVHLQKMHTELAGKGLAVLGFNCADDATIAKKLMRDHGVTYPTVLDSSPAALAAAQAYGMSGVPLTYVIDRDGKVVESFYGFTEGDWRGLDSLEKLGIQ
jgi:peroxiredoxin